MTASPGKPITDGSSSHSDRTGSSMFRSAPPATSASGKIRGSPRSRECGPTEPDRKRSPAAWGPAAGERGPHGAALGMRFDTGTMFPEKYRGQIFIAEHGSWNRSTPIGYRVTLVRVERGRATGYEAFAEGWLAGGRARGRA